MNEEEFRAEVEKAFLGNNPYVPAELSFAAYFRIAKHYFELGQKNPKTN